MTLSKEMKCPIPILRIFDEGKAREFYVDFLGFTIDWEHRFSDQMPLYLQVSRGDCVLHLSEHHGDCAPGSRIRIETPDLDEYVSRLGSLNYKNFNPSKPEMQPWGLREIDLPDPFGNRLTLYSE